MRELIYRSSENYKEIFIDTGVCKIGTEPYFFSDHTRDLSFEMYVQLSRSKSFQKELAEHFKLPRKSQTKRFEVCFDAYFDRYLEGENLLEREKVEGKLEIYKNISAIENTDTQDFDGDLFVNLQQLLKDFRTERPSDRVGKLIADRLDAVMNIFKSFPDDPNIYKLTQEFISRSIRLLEVRASEVTEANLLLAESHVVAAIRELEFFAEY